VIGLLMEAVKDLGDMRGKGYGPAWLGTRLVDVPGCPPEARGPGPGRRAKIGKHRNLGRSVGQWAQTASATNRPMGGTSAQ
jgi:hypothetical protein